MDWADCRKTGVKLWEGIEMQYPFNDGEFPVSVIVFKQKKEEKYELPH